MKYFSCQPDSHNAFVSFTNCTLSYFSVDSPHYRSLASAAAASAPSTPASPSLATGAAAGPSPSTKAKSAASPFSAADRVRTAAGPAAAAAAANGFAFASGHEATHDSGNPFAHHMSHGVDGVGSSGWNRNMSSTRLHIQHVVTLPDCFHSPTACFGIANHSLFGADMTVLGTSTGLLALVIPSERTLIYARGKDPAGVRDARQRVRQGTARPREAVGRTGLASTHVALDTSLATLEVPTTITWMRDQPIVLVGHNTGVVEWYEVRVHPAKARAFTDPSMETPYGPALPPHALMQHVNNPNTCPIEHLYDHGVGDGVWLECTASLTLPESGALTSSDHFPVAGHCVMSGERGLYVLSATQPGVLLCQLGNSGADFVYCHPCLPFIATLTYSWNAKQSALRPSPLSPERDRASPLSRSYSAGSPRDTAASPQESRHARVRSPVGHHSEVHDATATATAAAAGMASALLRNSDCVLHVYEYLERPLPTPVSPAPTSGRAEASAVREATGPRVAFRVDADKAADAGATGGDGARLPSRTRRASQRPPRFQLVPVLQRPLQASLPRYGAYFSLSWKFSFDLELAVCNAEEGWVRVLRLAKRGVGVQRVPPLSSSHSLPDMGPVTASYSTSGTGVSEVSRQTKTARSGMGRPGDTASTDSITGAALTSGHRPHDPSDAFPYVVVHEHRLRLPLHSLINVEYVSAATSALEASSLSPSTAAMAAQRGATSYSAAPTTTAAAARRGASATTDTVALPLQTLGAVAQMTMPLDAARQHHHVNTLFANLSAEERGLHAANPGARRTGWLQSMRGGSGGMGGVYRNVRTDMSANADTGRTSPNTPPPSITMATALPHEARRPSSALLLKENLLAMQLLQPAQKAARHSKASRSRTSSLGRSYTHASSSHAPGSSPGTSARGGGTSATGAVSLTSTSAAAIATLQTLLHVGAGRFSTCVGMNMAGEVAVVPVDREASTTWHDEGSVFVGLGSTLCAADIVTIQGVERHMKRRMEKGFGVSARSSLSALRSVAAPHRNADMEVLCSFIDLMEKAGLAASFGPVPSIAELVAWPTRPSLNRLVRSQCLPAYAVRQLQSVSYATDSRRVLLLHVLHWLPCSSRQAPAASRPSLGTGASKAHNASKGRPEWWCGDEVRVDARSTKVDVERAAAVEVLHGRLREGARLLLDYQSLDVTFTAMATLLSSPDDTLSSLQNSDDRVREAFLRSLSPWMLVMLLYVCSGAQFQDAPGGRTASTHDHRRQAGFATGPSSDASYALPGSHSLNGTGSRGSLLALVQDYRAHVLSHRGIPLWDRVAIAVILEPDTASLIQSFRTHLSPDCNLLQALLLEHGISAASYPHMQELVDCSGNFQLAACLYARIGAVSPAAAHIAATAARTCTAWRLSSGAYADLDDEDGEDSDEDTIKTATTTATTHELARATGPASGAALEPHAAAAGDTLAGGAGSSLAVAGAEKGQGEDNNATTTTTTTTTTTAAAASPVVRTDTLELIGGVGTPTTTAANTSTTDGALTRAGSEVVPVASAVGASYAMGGGSRSATRTGLPGTPRSPAYDPYVAFSPTLARARQYSLAGSVNSPLLAGSMSRTTAGGGGGGSSGVSLAVLAAAGATSSFEPRQSSEDWLIGATRCEDHESPSRAASAAAADVRPSGDGGPALTAPLPTERLQRLLQRSQLPAIAPELCGFGSPLAPLTLPPSFPNTLPDPTPASAAVSQSTASGATDMTAAPAAEAGGIAQMHSTGASAPGATTLTISATGTPLSATAASTATHTAASATAATTATHATATNGGHTASTAAGLHGGALSPSAQRAVALRELIFGLPAHPLSQAVSAASFSNTSFGAPTATAGRGADEADGDNPWLWWVEAYRAFLDSEQAFVKRTSFDIDCRRLKQLAEEAVAAAEEAIESAAYPRVGRTTSTLRRDRHTAAATGNKGRRPLEVPTSIVVIADGTGLRQPLEQQRGERGAGAAAQAAAVVAAAANVVIVSPSSADLVQRCVCGEHHFLTSQPLRMLLLRMTAGLPHCSVCDDVIQPVPARTMRTLAGDGKGGETTAALGWCTACMHGGHTTHLRSWFEVHKRCPVDGCSCHCNEESNLF